MKWYYGNWHSRNSYLKFEWKGWHVLIEIHNSLCINWSLLFHVAIPLHYMIDPPVTWFFTFIFYSYLSPFASRPFREFTLLILKILDDSRGYNSWKTESGSMIQRASSLPRKSVHNISCQDSLLLVLFESRKFRESILLYLSSGEYLQMEHFTKDWMWKESLKRLNHL